MKNIVTLNIEQTEKTLTCINNILLYHVLKKVSLMPHVTLFVQTLPRSCNIYTCYPHKYS